MAPKSIADDDGDIWLNSDGEVIVKGINDKGVDPLSGFTVGSLGDPALDHIWAKVNALEMLLRQMRHDRKPRPFLLDLLLWCVAGLAIGLMLSLMR